MVSGAVSREGGPINACPLQRLPLLRDGYEGRFRTLLTVTLLMAVCATIAGAVATDPRRCVGQGSSSSMLGLDDAPTSSFATLRDGTLIRECALHAGSLGVRVPTAVPRAPPAHCLGLRGRRAAE